jgi:hypothetical protein
MLQVSYSQLPQFIIFNHVFGEFVKQLCTKHATDYVVTALIKLLMGVAAATHPALGVKLLMRLCQDIQAGYYDLCEDADPMKEGQQRVQQTATPLEARNGLLWRIAERRKGHISNDAVWDEYNRLIQKIFGKSNHTQGGS